MIDLHLHTTASDGRCSPQELVDRAAAAGVTVLAVTDHDTTAASDDVAASASTRGIAVIPGIEITAIESGRDVHVLGYFIDCRSGSALLDFLAQQRASRVARLHAIAGRLAELGMPIDVSGLLDTSRRRPGRSIGRPDVARAMVAAGHVADTREAFDLWLGAERPAFISRAGVGIEQVIDVIHAACGLASLAHPGRTGIDGRIGALRDAGLDAIEVYHSDHEAADVDRYARLARDLQLLATGGSDFHGDASHGAEPGAASLPLVEWERLNAARHRYARAS